MSLESPVLTLRLAPTQFYPISDEFPSLILVLPSPPKTRLVSASIFANFVSGSCRRCA
jgi:hypothetical protein